MTRPSVARRRGSAGSRAGPGFFRAFPRIVPPPRRRVAHGATL